MTSWFSDRKQNQVLAFRMKHNKKEKNRYIKADKQTVLNTFDSVKQI